MTRYLLCQRCKDELHLHEEDVSNGFGERRVDIPKVRLPPGLAIVVTTMDGNKKTQEKIPVDQLKCDACGGFIEEGTPCVAVTHWRGVVEPESWELNYAQKEKQD